MHLKNLPVLFIVLTLAVQSTQAQLYTYTNDQSGAYSSIAANTTAANLTWVNGATPPSTPCSVGFSATSFTTATTFSDSLPGMQLSMIANPGYLLSVTGFSIGLRRSPTGPNDAELAYSIDNGLTWVNQDTIINPNNGSCGSTVTFTWSPSFVVPSLDSLQFRIYGFDASGNLGTMQILDLTVNGSVLQIDTITTSAVSFGPFCSADSDVISVPFTASTGVAGTYYVQLSNAAGVFPANYTSGLISTGGTSSPLRAVIPAGTVAGTGYRVRVVQQSQSALSVNNNGSNLVINQSVTPSFTANASQSSICSGENVSFTLSSITGSGASPTYQWYINHTQVATGSTYSSSALANGDTVYCVMTSNAVCATSPTATSNKTIMAVLPSLATALFDTLCPGTSLTFGGVVHSATGVFTDTLHAVAGCDSIVTLHLFASTLKTATLAAAICQGSSYMLGGRSYSMAGTYADTVRCDSILTLTLSVNPLPTISWAPSDTVLNWCGSTSALVLSGASPSGGSFSGMYVSGDSLVNTGINAMTWVHYSYTDANHCSASDSALFSLDKCSGITENTLISDISIYPNPTEGSVHLSIHGLTGASTVTMTDILGSTLFKKQFSGASVQEDINMSGFDKGLYFLTVRDAKSSGTRQLIKD